MVNYIQITTPPSKLTGYNIGDSLDLDGALIELSKDDKIIDITNKFENPSETAWITPSVFTAITTYVIFHYIDNGVEYTSTLTGIKVKNPNAWRFLDSNGLSYFYNQLLHTFPKADENVLNNKPKSKLAYFNAENNLDYLADFSLDDLNLINGLTDVSGDNFNEKVINIISSESNIIRQDEINDILKEEEE